MLSAFFISIGAAIIGGIAFRLRGSEVVDAYLGIGTTGGRAVWAILMGAVALIAGASIWLAILLTFVFFLSSIPGWPETSVAQLERGNDEFWEAFSNTTWRGMLFGVPAALALVFTGHNGLPLSLMSCSAGIAYAFGWACKGDWKLTLPSPDGYGHELIILQRGVPLGELVFGAALGWGLALSLL
jgi:hypothetical protein